MRERPLIFDSEHLSLRGDRNHIIVEFKGEPAVIDAGRLHHMAVRSVLKVDPFIEYKVIRISAIAVLKGRGIFMRIVNFHDSMSVNLLWEPGRIMLPAMNAADEIPMEDVSTYTRCTVNSGRPRWASGAILSNHFLSSSMSRRYSQESETNDMEMALLTWLREFAPHDALMPTRGGELAVAWCLDGITEKVCPPVKGKLDRKQFPLAIISLSYSLNQSSDHDCIMPLDYTKSLDVISQGRHARRMMRNGGIKAFIEICTGTSCKTMVKILAPRLTHIPPKTEAMIIAQRETRQEWPRQINLDLLSLKPLMTKLTIDHRVRLAELIVAGMKNGNTEIPIYGVQSALDVAEFFTIADHTKILDKCAEAMGIQEKILPFLGEAINQVPPDIADFAMANQESMIEPFGAMKDAGYQLKRWREKKFNKKQLQFFPEGIKIKSRWNSIKEIHDDISKQANKLEALENLGLMPWMDNFTNLHGLRCGPVRILLPRTNQTLVRWGKEQGHCVGSVYNRYMQKNECIIAGVFMGTELKYCIRLTPVIKATLSRAYPEDPRQEDNYDREITGWSLEEFRGKSNCWPNADHAAYVIKALDKAGMNTSKWIYGNGPVKTSDQGKWAECILEPMKVTTTSENVKNFMQKKPILTAKTGSDNV